MGCKQRASGLSDRVSECRTTRRPCYRQANTSRRASDLYEAWKKQGQNSEIIKADARKIVATMVEVYKGVYRYILIECREVFYL